MPEAIINLDPAILDHNLAALERADAAVAKILQAARPCMPAATIAATRDGKVNFRLPTPDGGMAWFGRTSIPQTRAAALISQFQAGTANVLLPSIGEGSEAALLLKQLGTHRAVFIWESDPVNVLLSLRLHDFAEAIDDDRLVFIIADEQHFAETLLSALEKRPGHYCPDRIMIWPGQTVADMADLRAAVESVYHRIEQHRGQQLAEQQRRFSALPITSPKRERGMEPPEPFTAALLAIQSNQETRALADCLTSTANNSGWQFASAVIRKPTDMHPLSRVSKLVDVLDHLPRMALLLDTCRTEVADVLPPNVPAVTWLTHHMPAKNVASRLGPADKVMAVDSALAEDLKRAGLQPDRITIRPLPCLIPDNQPTPDWDERPINVLMLANLAAIDPGAYGHELSTHIKIWQTAVEVIRNRANHFTDADIESVIDAAESRLKVCIDHPEAREHLSAALAGPVASTIIWQNIAQLATEHKLNIACCGTGWPKDCGLNLCGPIPNLANRTALYRQAKCIVFASTTGRIPPDVLLAAQAGAAIVWRRHRRDGQPGGLAQLLQPDNEVIVYGANSQLPSTLQKLLSSPDGWRSVTHQARQRCQADHMPKQALAALEAIATSFNPNQTT